MELKQHQFQKKLRKLKQQLRECWILGKSESIGDGGHSFLINKVLKNYLILIDFSVFE
jgi:hypothetical protein